MRWSRKRSNPALPPTHGTIPRVGDHAVKLWTNARGLTAGDGLKTADRDSEQTLGGQTLDGANAEHVTQAGGP